jgi:hypothetical protein
MKSAYELALERLEQRGIDRPEALSDELREQMAEVRRQADAKLAELEILHAKSLQEEDYARERRRIEEDRDRKIAKLRA